MDLLHSSSVQPVFLHTCRHTKIFLAFLSFHWLLSHHIKFLYKTIFPSFPFTIDPDGFIKPKVWITSSLPPPAKEKTKLSFLKSKENIFKILQKVYFPQAWESNIKLSVEACWKSLSYLHKGGSPGSYRIMCTTHQNCILKWLPVTGYHVGLI